VDEVGTDQRPVDVEKADGHKSGFSSTLTPLST
jgi:hypothetical protein